MFKSTLNSFKKLINFPGVISPPESITSRISIFSIHLNIAFIVIIYAFLNDIIIATAAAFILFFNHYRYSRHAKPLRKLILLGLQGLCVLLFLWRFNGSVGGQSWLGLLTLLICLKSLEASNIRDYYVTTLMLFFLAAIIFAYNNSAIAPIILAFYSISILTSLMLLSNSNIPVSLKSSQNKVTDTSHLIRDLKKVWNPAGKIFIQALPITIILFFLFPRIQGSFGFLPGENSNLKPSLPNGMNTGTYSDRSASKKLAFRVEFLPDVDTGIRAKVHANDMYWRVKTFSQQQGFNWYMNKALDLRSNQQKLSKKQIKEKKTSKNFTRYSITHQATADNHLPSLGTLVDTQFGTILNNQTIKSRSQASTFQYQASSKINSRNILSPSLKINAKLHPIEQQEYLQTTFKPGIKTKNLLNSWLNEVNLPEIGEQQATPNSQQAKDLALKALKYFREQPFSYHLLPPEIDKESPIEDFLFRTQSGYCEHYSSTFSTLMRWLKVPTRIVAGFQGGELNEQGQFYEVRFSSAHAWSEIWTNDDGWIRTDPTAAVAPERIEFGMDALFALMGQSDKDSFNSGDFSLTSLRNALTPSGSLRIFQQTNNWLGAANHSWDKWIVNYDFEQQKKLLKKLGLNSDNQYATLTILLSVIMSIVAGIIIWLIWPKRVKRTAIDEAYDLFKKKINKLDIPINESEGPLALTQRLTKKLPNHAGDIQHICQYYIENKYQNNNINLKRLLEEVKKFRPSLA